MKRILHQLAVCALVTLCLLSRSPVTAQVGEAKQASTAELLAEFRTLFATSPLETQKVVDAIFVDSLHFEFENLETQPKVILKSGKTKNGLPVDFQADQY